MFPQLLSDAYRLEQDAMYFFF